MRIAVLLFLMSFCGPFLALATSPARDDSSVLLVLHAPWVDGPDLAAEVGGRMIGPLRTPIAFLAAPEQTQFAQHLRSRGMLLFDGARLAALCGETT